MNRQVIKNRIRKILVYSFTAIVFLLVSGFLILQIPPVQNKLIRHYLKDFSQVVGFPTTVKSFRMLWFDRLELNDVNIYDTEGNRMIGVKEILINFKVSQLFRQRDINVDGIFIDSADVFLTKINESDTSRDLNINVFINKINEKFSSGSGKPGGNPPKINIGEAFLNQSRFTMINQDHDSIKYGFDYHHFSLLVDEGQLKSFVLLGDTIEFDVRTLIAEDQASKFRVNQLSTFFRICQKSMEFTGLNIKAGNSTITDTVIFTFDSQRDLNDFVHNVRVHTHFVNTVIHPKDLAVFAPGVERVKQPITLSGNFNGRIDKFKLTQMDLMLGNTNLSGSLEMEGLPNIDETFIILNLRNSILDPHDIAFLFNDQTMQRIEPIGTVRMQGQFLGYPSDFVANGNFHSKLGSIRSDINFKVNEKDIDRSEYSGKLTLADFDMGTYLKDTILFQKVNLDGQVKGSGLTMKTADFVLNGRISSIGINGYNYTRIKTDARFASGLIRGLVEVNDPNLEFTARGAVDFREGRNEVRLRASLDTAYLHKLNLSRDSLFISTKLDADIRGIALDSLHGIANFNDLHILYKGEDLSSPNIHIEAQRLNRNRSLKFESALVDAEIKGNFNYSDLSRDIQTLIEEILLNLQNDKAAIARYYANKNYRPEKYEAIIKLDIKNLDPIADLLDLDLKLSRNTQIDGRFSSGYTTIFNAYSSFDSLTWQGKTFINTEVEVTTSKIADSTNVLSMATITSEQQLLNPNVNTKNLLAEIIWNKNHIDFELDADQQIQNNYVRLKGGVDFLRDSTVISMQPSALKLLERDWTFDDGNYIAIKGREWSVHNLALQNESQSVRINGTLSDDPSKILSLNLDKVDLALLNAISPHKINGVVDAQIDMSNYYDKPAIQNDIFIRELRLNDFLVGDITGKNQWDTALHKFDVNLFIDREGKRIINLTGDYKPTRRNSPLNVTAKLENANLKILEPFLEGIFSNTGGTVSGTFGISGQLAAPDLRGDGEIQDGLITVSYLKTTYHFTGIIGLTPRSIDFKNIELTDILRNKGRLHGSISHEGFHKMYINLEATFRNFQVLNTTSKDNSLFYGQGYATGDVSFRGPVSNLAISSTARTDKNTRIYIPLSGSSSVEKKDFITFINFRDTALTKKIETDFSNKVDITGLSFDFNIDVTPDAYCEIIFDLKSGDIIRGRGNGDLKLELNTKGEFNMFGPFEFTEGFYNFTLYDIVNKEFTISKGSRITWYGDPYQATVRINASYNQLASLAPLITDPNIGNSPQLQRKYPVQVLLKLDGPMMTPGITFDIVAEDLPKNIQTESGRVVNLDLEFAAFKNKLDEQELNRQVFSLIVLRRLSPLNAGIDASGSLFNSVSELLSNQLSYWMSQVDEDLVIDVDLGSMDEEKFNTFQLRLSYTFLNGRLRVTGDGTFNNNTTTPTTGTSTNPSSVAGDWTVDYMLTADGKLRVKMYSRTNVNPLLSSVNTNPNAITTGASVIHTQSFDRIRDLWKSSREKRKEQPVEENPEINTEAIKEEDGTD
ncbi:MAG TPA: translocation/assembly module TamB domain-containing protein [Ohtaekwangia sp.]